jgi:hypothetical protein
VKPILGYLAILLVGTIATAAIPWLTNGFLNEMER